VRWNRSGRRKPIPSPPSGKQRNDPSGAWHGNDWREKRRIPWEECSAVLDKVEFQEALRKGG